jgi:hypothetical protein
MRLVILIAGLIAAMPVHATIITIDASDFAANSSISGIGASFSVFGNEDGSVGYEPLLARASFIPTAGANLFGSSSTSMFGGMLDAFPCLVNPSCVGNSFRMLRVDFDSPTDYVSMRAVVSEWTDPGAMWAFRRDGSFISSCHFFGATSHGYTPQYSTTLFGHEGGPCGSAQSIGCDDSDPSECFTYYNSIAIASSSPEIAFVLFGGYAQSWNRHSADRISYSVPEPGTLAMLSLGLLGAFAVRRRRCTTSNLR